MFAQVTTTSLNSSTDTSFAIFSGVWMFFWLIVAVLAIAAMWKIFTKANKHGWAAIVPIYNVIVLLEVVGRPLWWIILLIIPFVNIIVGIVIAIDLAKSFGKDALFGVVACWLFSIVGYLILGFGSAQYVGPAAAKGQSVTPPSQPVA